MEKKTLLGALDFRTALFKLHVLKNIKKELTSKAISYKTKSQKKIVQKGLHLEKDFERLCEAIHHVIFGMAYTFSKEHSIDAHFENNFMGYFNAVRKLDRIPQGAIFTSFEKALNFVTKAVLYGANKNDLSSEDVQLVEHYLTKNVLHELQAIFLAEKVDMFGHFSDRAKRRIKGAYGTLK